MNCIRIFCFTVLGFLFTTTLSAQDMQLEDQLILYLPMSGNANDESGREIPTLVDGPQLTSDRHGNPKSAYLFDGIDDHIVLNNNRAVITSMEYTISIWARMDGQSQAKFHSNSLFEQRDPTYDHPRPVVIHFNADQEHIFRHIVRTSAESPEYKTDTPFPGYGDWHHFLALIDEDRMMRLYLDGEFKTSTPLLNNGNFKDGVSSVHIGAHYPWGYQGGAFNGAIDEVRIYSRALSACEIEALYSGQLLEER